MVKKKSSSELIESVKLIDKFKCKTNTETVSTVLYECSEIYSLSLRRIEQVLHKFLSIIQYEKENNNRFFDSHILIQLLCEFEHTKYHAVYLARKLHGMETTPVTNSFDPNYNGKYHNYVLRNAKKLNQRYSSQLCDDENVLYQLDKSQANGHDIKKIDINIEIYYQVAWRNAFAFTNSDSHHNKTILDRRLKNNIPKSIIDINNPPSFSYFVYSSYISNVGFMESDDLCFSINQYYDYVELAQTIQ